MLSNKELQDITKRRRVELKKHRQRRRLIKRGGLSSDELAQLTQDHVEYKTKAVAWAKNKPSNA